jgi:glycerol-3-phosphate dehydrogenase
MEPVQEVDLLVVGGGINGAAIARDAAGRGLDVLLVERDDLAAHTSSASTKLVHGGLRYLEHFQFGLVRKSLAERERLLRSAPHIVRPLRIVVPQAQSGRPAWLVRLGLLVYDHLGGRGCLPPTRTIRLDGDLLGQGLAEPTGSAFVYSDCTVDDSRLVILNAIDARERGARVCPKTELLAARPHGRSWIATLGDGDRHWEVRARVLVNATGPWVSALFDRLDTPRPPRAARLVKGSHIVVPRLYDGDHAFLIQNFDGRIVFAIPFEGIFTLIGTTELRCDAPLADPAITGEEIAYLLDAVHQTFATKVDPSDVRWTYSGIRPLCDDHAASPSAVSRDYMLDLQVEDAPLLSVFGGKITTHRRLAEDAMGRLAHFFPRATGAWTGNARLPGGDIPQPAEAYGDKLRSRYPFLSPRQSQRLARSYGSRAHRLLGDATAIADLGEAFGPDLTSREINYLIAEEWATTAEDILFRRTKLALTLPAEIIDRVAAYVSRRLAHPSSPEPDDRAA